MTDYVTCEHGRHRLCIKCAEETPEPWCRECGVPVVDKDAHDRWHARFEGSPNDRSVRPVTGGSSVESPAPVSGSTPSPTSEETKQ